jgi:hypothetical protein
MLAEKILGVWELQSWETVVDDKVVGYPLGEQTSGFLVYHPIGFMSDKYFSTQSCSPPR